MGLFKYKMSVVVPIYNCEGFIENCIENLSKQTMAQKDFEIILVNDGSSDNSGDICRKYAEKAENIRYFEHENSGVSVTRNVGIDNASGKYILFLDADDTLSANTLENICDFFDENYDNTDIVTYRIKYLYENGKTSDHQRYGILRATGIYSIDETPGFAQSTMNICIKNLPENLRLYFKEGLRFGEDQTFITEWIMKKRCIGFVSDAIYFYFRHSGSASSDNSHRFDFDLYISLLDNYIKTYGDDNGLIPAYIQHLILYNLNWRYTANCLVNSHDEEERKAQTDVLKRIMSRIDTKTVADSIYVDPYHREFFLTLKDQDFRIFYDSNNQAVISDDTLVFSDTPAKLYISDLKILNDTMIIRGCVKNNFEKRENVEFFYEDDELVLHKIDLTPTTFSRYHASIQTNDFGGFDFAIPLGEFTAIKFKTKINGYFYNAVSFFNSRCIINPDKTRIYSNGYTVILNCDSPTFQKITVEKTNPPKALPDKISADYSVFKESKKAFIYRFLSKFIPGGDIWLYIDRENIFDNAYYQFIHDFDKKDRVKRYYIAHNITKQQLSKFTGKQRRKIVKFKKLKHKLLFFKSSKVISSFESVSLLSPFDNAPLKWYSDIINCRIIYLQHGILHAELPVMYSKERCMIDKIVVSSQFEVDNFIENYHYKNDDIIRSGMPRLDYISTDVKPQRKILFAPSWRKNLIGEYVNNERELREDLFVESDFYKKTTEFLNSPELEKLLEENDLVLDYKNHPIFSGYDKLFETKNKRVNILSGDTNMDEYMIMITDYSSIVFDCVYAKRPIIYFAPDYDQFKKGITHTYSVLSIPLEDAFGALTFNKNDLIEEIRKIIANGFEPLEKYRKKMDNFFLSTEKDHCDRLYEELINP